MSIDMRVNLPVVVNVDNVVGTVRGHVEGVLIAIFVVKRRLVRAVDVSGPTLTVRLASELDSSSFDVGLG